jgi:hypothetical protein
MSISCKKLQSVRFFAQIVIGYCTGKNDRGRNSAVNAKPLTIFVEEHLTCVRTRALCFLPGYKTGVSTKEF